MENKTDLKQISVTATQFGTDKYTYNRPNTRDYIIVNGWAVATDSNFRSDGKFRGRIGSTEITSEGAVPNTGVDLINDLGKQLYKTSRPVLAPNETITFDFLMSSGTGTVAVVLDIDLVTPEELKRLRELGDVL